MPETFEVRRTRRRLGILALALAPLLPIGSPAQQEMPPEVGQAAATVAAIDAAVQALDVEALGRLLAPEFTEASRGCGPEKPRKSRQEFLATFATLVGMRPTSYRRERGQLEIKLVDGGRTVAVRSQVTDRAEWSSGSLTGTSQETLFLTRVGDGYAATSLDAEMACTDMKLVGTIPAPPGD